MAWATATFDGPAGSDLSAIGQNLVRHANGSSSGAYIRTNGTHAHAAVTSGNAIYRCTVAPPAADYSMSVPVVKRSVSDSSAGAVARLHDTAATFYLAHHDNNTGWRLLKCVNGSFTVLGAPYAQTLTLDQEYICTIEVIGTAIKCIVDGVTRVTATDSDITAAGFAGIQLNGANSNSTQDYQLASFSADAIESGASFALTAAEGADSAAVVWNMPTNLSITAVDGADSAAVSMSVPVSYETVFADYFAAQWNTPGAVVRNGALYVCWTDAANATGITKHVHGGATTSFTLSAGSGTTNGHNSGVVGFLPDGRLLALWAKHNDQMYYRISTNPEDISAWGAVQTLSTTLPVSYSNLHYLSITGKYYTHYRTGNGGGPGDRPCRARSTANGTTWDAERVWINEPDERPYVMSWGNGVDRIDFVATSKHQADSGPAAFGIYHCYMIVDEVGVERFYKSDGTYISTGNVRPTTQMTLIYDASSVPGWPWAITGLQEGFPRVLWAKHVGDYENYHMCSRWNGATWVASQIGEPQSRLYYAEAWSDGGLCFDAQNQDVIYRSVQGPLLSGGAEWDVSAWEMQVWRTDDDARTWTKIEDITSGGAAAFKNCRPISPRNHDGRDAVIWSAGTISNWDNFDLDCRAAPSRRVEISLTDRSGGSVANTTGLDFFVMDAATPAASAKPLARGSTGRIDADGIARLPAPGATGSAVFVVLSDTDGDAEADSHAFAAPVAVI